MKIKLTEQQVSNLSSMLLNEATAEEIRLKYYPTIPIHNFNEIVNADETSSNLEKNKLGEYGKWLLKLYVNKRLKAEDLYKATDYIKIFDKAKKSKKLEQNDINQYKSIGELFLDIQKFKTVSDISKSDITKNVKNDEADLVYEDEMWKVIVPKTENAACIYGANTQWCTAAKHNNMFDQYNEEGKLYININKQNGEKYQFHFETDSFMNENDIEIKLRNVGLTQGLQQYYDSVNEKFRFLLKYDDVYKFVDGFAVFTIYNKFGVINTQGKEIIPPNYSNVEYIRNGLFKVDGSNSRTYSEYGLINTKGEIVIPLKYNTITDVGSDKGKIYRVVDGNSGLYDNLGNKLTPLKYDFIDYFKYNIGIVRLNQKYGLIDNHGKEVTPIHYDYFRSSFNGQYIVGRREGEDYLVYGDGTEININEK